MTIHDHSMFATGPMIDDAFERNIALLTAQVDVLLDAKFGKSENKTESWDRRSAREQIFGTLLDKLHLSLVMTPVAGGAAPRQASPEHGPTSERPRPAEPRQIATALTYLRSRAVARAEADAAPA